MFLFLLGYFHQRESRVMKISQKKLPSVIYRKSNWLSAGSLWLSWLLWRRDWIYSNKCVSSILFYFGAVVNFKEWWIDIGTMNIRQSSETVVVILKDSHASFLFEITLKMSCEKASLTEHLTACSKCGILLLSVWYLRISRNFLKQTDECVNTTCIPRLHSCLVKFIKWPWIDENHTCQLRIKTWIWKRSSY